MNRKFLFVIYSENGMSKSFLKDLNSDERAIIFGLRKNPHNKFLKLLCQFHLSSKINRKISLPFKSIWMNSLNSVISDSETEYHVIFVSPLFPIDKLFASNLNKKKRTYRIRYHLFMVDAWDNAFFSEDYIAKIDIDDVFTFDENDAQRHKFIFHYVPFSMLGKPCDEIKYDLYFAGHKRGGGYG